MNKRIYWNRDWEFISEYTDELLKEDYQSDEMEQVELPHMVEVTPYHYFDESIYQKLCGYRRRFKAEESWKNKRIIMTVEAAGHSAVVYLNGKQIAEHACGYTAFKVDMSEDIILGEVNTLVVKLDSRENLNVPPFGHVIDYMTFGGLYREVYIEIKETHYIEDVFPKTLGIVENKPVLKSEIIVNADGTKYILKSEKEMTSMSQKGLNIKQTLHDASDGKLVKDFEINHIEHDAAGITVWDTTNPKLYVLKTELIKDGKVLDSREDRIGFREADFRVDGFYLNGKKFKIRGLNRHQSYPYVGYAMPKSMQIYDADILKNELGANAVRTSHYPQSHHFLNRCDELGLLVFTEIPGWQHIGDEKWQAQAVENTKEMVLEYRNHPSIILWGVRINESCDNDAFYEKTNAVAHELDDTRSTSGVRFIQKSSLLEDVYAYNDFSHEGNNPGCCKKRNVTTDVNKGYLISEYNGHMYPTKAYDAEDHRVEHMLRHARVMNAYYSEDDIAGGFAWCMFDYNTHQDFGSGDRICYHGVCDMFRNPKLAAALYKCQDSKEDVLEISSAMDIGEHPACMMKDVYALTNADSVKFYKNDVFIKEFMAKDTAFDKLPHGPILINDFIGEHMRINEGFTKSKDEDVKAILMAACKYGMNNLPLSIKLLAAKCMLFRGMKMQDAIDLYTKYIGNWGGSATVYKFEAIKDGKVVATSIKKPMTKGHLEVKCSHTRLSVGNTYDVAAVRIQACSEDGNVLNFSHAPLQLIAEGDIELIGPSMISLHGGMSGTYIKTKNNSGKGHLIIRSESFEEVEIEFDIES